ncbi:MAG: hypothetical protein H6586_01065 [Flavobacteriales bacterium]|nr:hypothetical protein [Flavobacteriales bacterium]
MNFKVYYFLIMVFVLMSCKKVDIDDIDNLNGGLIYVIGHRGMGIQSPYNQFPENSFISITKAIEVYGVDGVEIDVQLTKDIDLVLYHDDKLETSSNGNGYVYQYNLNELTDFKYNRDIYANLFADEYLISLETVLQRYSQQTIKPQLHLDLRSWLYDADLYNSADFFALYATKIVDILNQYQYIDNAYITSGSVELLKEISQRDGNLKLMVESTNVNWAIENVKDNNWYGIVVYNNSISKSDIKFAHSLGIRVSIFGVKIQSEIVSAVKKNPDFIITDNIPNLQQILYN